MAELDKEELQKMSKSKFGKFQAEQPNPALLFLEKYILKTTPRKSYLYGCLTVGVLGYLWFTKNPLPLFIWVAYLIVISIAGIIYWNAEKKRLDAELTRCENELAGINQEIKERKKYFEDLRRQIEENSKN